MAYCVNPSSLRASLRSMYRVGSNPLSSQANCVLNLDASKCVIGAAPLTPFIRFCHVEGTSLPSGVTAPNPVITTRLSSMIIRD